MEDAGWLSCRPDRVFHRAHDQSEEHARRGFELLLARPGFEAYFDALSAGIRTDSQSAPVQVDGLGFPSADWATLDYRNRCEASGERKTILSWQRL